MKEKIEKILGIILTIMFFTFTPMLITLGNASFADYSVFMNWLAGVIVIAFIIVAMLVISVIWAGIIWIWNKVWELTEKE